MPNHHSWRRVISKTGELSCNCLTERTSQRKDPVWCFFGKNSGATRSCGTFGGKAKPIQVAKCLDEAWFRNQSRANAHLERQRRPTLSGAFVPVLQRPPTGSSVVYCFTISRDDAKFMIRSILTRNKRNILHLYILGLLPTIFSSFHKILALLPHGVAK